ncbi:MAG: hypothetical protein KAX49_11930, partial [Halanaerobiales bacterium]|nr:hypothetical protein [Halanaerobiales bacterium]
AVGDIVVNTLHEGNDYSVDQAFMDFAMGFVGDLTASAAGDLIDKYGAKVVAQGLNKLGIDGDRIKQLTGIDLGVPNICFTEETLVSTKKGFKQIKGIKIGDEVYSENVDTGEKGLKKVKNIFINDSYILLHISFEDTEIKTTLPHPFYVVGKGWIEAKDLIVGDKLKLISGEEVEIKDIKKEKLEKPVKVYNFEVEDWHTYYVSEYAVLVHNTGSNPCAEVAGEFVEGTKLLPSEGNIGNYDELIKTGKRGDDITPHHMPSDKYMRQYNVTKGEGLSINMEQPKVGGRHRLTDTYGRNMTNIQKEFYYSLSPRDALAYDIKNLRNIYKQQGLYKEILPQLRKYSKTYIEYMPNIFNKGAQ